MRTEQTQRITAEEVFTIRLLESQRIQTVEYDLLEWKEGDEGRLCRYLFRVRSGDELALECFDGTREEAAVLFGQICGGQGTPCTLTEIVRDRRLEARLAGR